MPGYYTASQIDFLHPLNHTTQADCHILVFMISPEERRMKPYALSARQLANVVIDEMVKRNMKVAGEYMALDARAMCARHSIYYVTYLYY